MNPSHENSDDQFTDANFPVGFAENPSNIEWSILLAEANISLDIGSWLRVNIPNTEVERRMLNWPRFAWIVDRNEDRILISPSNLTTPKPTLPFELNPQGFFRMLISSSLEPEHVIEVDDGFLIGFNKGEFGGEISWVSKSLNFTIRTPPSLFASMRFRVLLH